VLVMYLGKLVEVSPPEALYQDPHHPYSAALISAIPSGEGGTRNTRIRLQGTPPSPIDPPSGCRFHTRCPMAQPICSAEEPELRAISEARFVACHFPLGEG
jgi:oligopeptide/dipeptide ABC transporter ATP-binding protein